MRSMMLAVAVALVCYSSIVIAQTNVLPASGCSVPNSQTGVALVIDVDATMTGATIAPVAVFLTNFIRSMTSANLSPGINNFGMISVGIISYSTTATVRTSGGLFAATAGNSAVFTGAIAATVTACCSGTNDVATAITSATTMLTGAGLPVNATQYMIIVTDSPPLSQSAAVIASQTAQLKGIQIIVIGLGELVNSISLKALVTPPVRGHYYAAPRDTSATLTTRVLPDLVATVRNSPATCVTIGDPRVWTFDGQAYSFQGAGDYWLVRSKNTDFTFDVQARLIACGSGLTATCIGALALTDGTNKIQLYAYDGLLNAQVFVNGVKVTPSAGTTALGFANIVRTAKSFQFVFSAGHSIMVMVGSTSALAVYITIAPGLFTSSQGLCGLYDGCTSNEFMARSGSVIASVNDFAMSWQVPSSSTLFDQNYLTPTATLITDLADVTPVISNPANFLAATSFDPFWPVANMTAPVPVGRRQPSEPEPNGDARDVCGRLQTISNFLYTSCLYDVTLTDDKRYADDAWMLAVNECVTRCTTGHYLSASWTINTPSPCRAAGICLDQDPDNDLQGVDLHFNYSSLDFVPAIVVDNHALSLVVQLRPQSFGGAYTFSAITDNWCGPATFNVTGNFVCADPTPAASITGPATVNPIPFLGFPEVSLVGAVTNVLTMSMLELHWKIVTSPQQTQQTISGGNVPAIPTRGAADSAYFFFTPPIPGLYTVEFAAWDGCTLTKAQMNVTAQCNDCTINAQILTNTNGTAVMGLEALSLFGTPLTTKWRNLALSTSTTTDPNVGAKSDFLWQLYNSAGEQIATSGNSTGVFNTTTIIVNTTTVFSNGASAGVTGVVINPSVPILHNNRAIKVRTTFTTPVTNMTNTTTVLVTQVLNNPFSPIAEPGYPVCSFTIVPDASNNLVVTAQDQFSTLYDQFYGGPCLGTYSLNLTATDTFICQKSTDSVPVRVLCDGAVYCLAMCTKDVAFDYATKQFLVGSITADDSYDSLGRPIMFRFSLAGRPPTSLRTDTDLLLVTQPSRNLRPDVQGNYTIAVGVSNGCANSWMRVTLNALCGKSVLAIASPSVPTTNLYNGLTATLTYVQNGSLSGSDNTNANPTYLWTVTTPLLPIPDPDAAPTFAATSVNPSVVVHYPGTYTATVTVTDGCTTGTAATTFDVQCDSTITVSTTVPTTSNFIAGSVFETLTFDASASTATSPTFTPVRSWRYVLISKPTGSALAQGFPAIRALSTVATFAFTPDVIGSYTMRVDVTDGCKWGSQTIIVNAVVAIQAIIDLPVNTPYIFNQLLTLSGILSTGVISTYSWTMRDRPSGSTALIVNPTQMNSTFTPDAYGTYTVELRVSNSQAFSIATAQFTVICPPANVFTAQARSSTAAVTYSENRFPRVEVDAATSLFGPQAFTSFTYTWEFLSAPLGSVYAPTIVNTTTFGTPVIVTDTNTVRNGTFRTTVTNSVITFVVTSTSVQTVTRLVASSRPTVPGPACFDPDLPGTYNIRLTMADACQSSISLLSVLATCNAAPVIVLSGEPTAPLSVDGVHPTSFVLHAANSTDANADILSFSWYFLQQPTPLSSVVIRAPAWIQHPNAPITSIAVVTPGNYIVQLAITDGCSIVLRNISFAVGCGSVPQNTSKVVTIVHDPRRRGAIGARPFELLQQAPAVCPYPIVWRQVTSVSVPSSAVTSSTGLSSGQVAGIAVGASVAFIVIVVGLVCCIRKRGGGSDSGPAAPNTPV